MTNEQLQRLNRVLGDRLGRIPAGFPNSGDPAFQFKRKRELSLVAKVGYAESVQPSGLVAVVPVYAVEEQFPEEPDCWCIAKWYKPGSCPPEIDGAFGEPGAPVQLSPEEWHDRFGDIGWQAEGWWYGMQPLKEGYQPTEEWAHWAADHLDWQGSMSLRETMYRLQDRRNRIEESKRSEVVAALRDNFVNHVPGARGGSYLAFTEKST